MYRYCLTAILSLKLFLLDDQDSVHHQALGAYISGVFLNLYFKTLNITQMMQNTKNILYLNCQEKVLRTFKTNNTVAIISWCMFVGLLFLCLFCLSVCRPSRSSRFMCISFPSIDPLYIQHACSLYKMSMTSLLTLQLCCHFVTFGVDSSRLISLFHFFFTAFSRHCLTVAV